MRHDTLLMEGECGADGSSFGMALRAIALGGAVRTIGDFLSVEGADSVTLLLSAQTTFRCRQPVQVCLEQLDRAAGMSYEQLVHRHQAEYREKFERFSLTLGTGKNGASRAECSDSGAAISSVTEVIRASDRVECPHGTEDDLPSLPTDRRLNLLKDSVKTEGASAENSDPELIALYVQYGRYLLISCSRRISCSEPARHME